MENKSRAEAGMRRFYASQRETEVTKRVAAEEAAKKHQNALRLRRLHAADSRARAKKLRATG
jgi:hypothetical protein